MSKLFPTQEIGSLKKPADMLKKVKDVNVSDEEKIEARNNAALLNIKTLEDIGLDIIYDGEVRRVEMYEEPVRYVNGFEFAGRVRSWDNKYYNKARVVGPVSFRQNTYSRYSQFFQYCN